MPISTHLDQVRLADLARDPNHCHVTAQAAHDALRRAQLAHPSLNHQAALFATIEAALQPRDVAQRDCFDAALADLTDDSFTSLQPLGDAQVMVCYSWDSNESLSIDGATIGAEFASIENFSNHVRSQWEKAIRAEEAKATEIAGWGE